MVTPDITTAVIRTITAITNLDSMRLRVTLLAALNLLLAAAMAAVGFQGTAASFLRLPSEATIQAIRDGEPVDKADDEEAVDRLRSASALSNASRADLALALLAGGEPPDSAADKILGDHAVRQLLTYLSAAPDDPFAWANLAMAEKRRGTLGATVTPFKMSIELAPTSATDLIWRCDFGTDIYPALDDEGKEMLARQFLMAMDPTLDPSVPENLVRLLKKKNNLSPARTLLARDQEASRKFEKLVSMLP